MKILLGMSGGLDSTYAAELLKSRGYAVEGAAVIMHEYTDLKAAKLSARELGIPLHVIDARDLFRREIEEYFIHEYRCGRTPNPCVVCNPRVKIGELCRFAASNGFERVATGHYARTVERNGLYGIAMGGDSRKDQSYMLWGLSPEQIKMLCFPLGELTKDEVRARAAQLGLSSAGSKESQDVCFIPDGDYVVFVESRSGKMPDGSFVDDSGKELGRHRGIINYTVGQRRGLGVAMGQRMFVSEIRAEKNEILLRPDGGKYCSSMVIDGLNYQLMPPVPQGEVLECTLMGKIRYAAKPEPMKLRIEGASATVTFSEPIRAVTPGQSAVFYTEDNAIALGGFISHGE
ncbi:MAG: tRNA 2-thiouridine(34) synthase MnmA [Clostridia bacterium]|nr:tRNA 2-thiouridine(34) synthase MnmA [Clostridia bacterium]